MSPLPGLSRHFFDNPTAYAVGSGSFAPPALFATEFYVTRTPPSTVPMRKACSVNVVTDYVTNP